MALSLSGGTEKIMFKGVQTFKGDQAELKLKELICKRPNHTGIVISTTVQVGKNFRSPSNPNASSKSASK